MAHPPNIAMPDAASGVGPLTPTSPAASYSCPSPHLPLSSSSAHATSPAPELELGHEKPDHRMLTSGEAEPPAIVRSESLKQEQTDNRKRSIDLAPYVDPVKSGLVSDSNTPPDDNKLNPEPTVEQEQEPTSATLSIAEGRLEEEEPDSDAMSTIDPRMLLNPKGTNKRQRTDSPSAESKRTRVDQVKYDPRALLNPKAAAGAAKQDEQTEQHPPENEEDVGAGMGSMIERMHGIQRREDQPIRTKALVTPKQKDDQTKKGHFNGGGSGSVLSDYVAEKKKESAREAGPSAVVDLTDDKEDDDDDDDLVITGGGPAPAETRRLFGINDEDNKQVCLGKLEEAYANYTIVPSPASGFVGSSSAWPAIKVGLRRRPGEHNFIVSLVDPTGKDFGKLDIKNAMALVPLLNAADLNLKLACRIDPRRKRDGEVAGGPASNRLALNITMFAPRKHAKAIGKTLSQTQNWLRQPTIHIGTIPYENPQQIQPAAPRNPTLPSSSTAYNMTRTQEEIRSEVISMFDSLAKSDDIPEMQSDDQVITTPLLPHQKQALHFMTSRETTENDTGLWKLHGSKWYNVITGCYYKSKPEPVRGGILADMMGLGKTLEILSLIAATKADAQTFATISPAHIGINSNGSGDSRPPVLLRCNSRATLLICPLSTIANWQEQIAAHTRGLKSCVYHGPNRPSVAKELATYDIVITTYQVVSSEYNQSRPLSQINWFRVVLDEAHMIRSQSTKQSLACCALNAERRWPVTGTPVQNRLDDLGALIKFLRVHPFDEKNGFAQYILTPFKNADPDILPKLRILVDSITLRRQKDKINLPSRHDLIVRLEFSPDERELFDLFAKDTFRKMQAMTAGRDALAKNDMGHVLKAISRLRLICAHGAELLSDEDMKIAEGMTYKGAIEIDEDEDGEQSQRSALTKEAAYGMLNLMRESEIDICALCHKQLGSQTSTENSDDESDTRRPYRDDTIGFMTPCFHLLCSSPECLNKYRKPVIASSNSNVDKSPWVDYADCPVCNKWIRTSLFELKQSESDREEAAKARVTRNMNSSMAKRMARYGGPHTKVKALINELHQNKQWNQTHPDEPPIKSVVFSGWTGYLDLISIALQDQDFCHTRLDGGMSRQKRADALDQFKSNPKVEVILISIMAGGLGLNLTTGSKAYVMEPQYNPAAEAQAVDRIHRLGQTREVTVTRFIMRDSFEERMLELQQKKKDLADLSMNRNVKLDKHEAAKRKLEDLRSLFR